MLENFLSVDFLLVANQAYKVFSDKARNCFLIDLKIRSWLCGLVVKAFACEAW